MAKECIQRCPVIKGIIDSIEYRNFWSGPLALHPNAVMGSNAERLLNACENSYRCSGPRVEEVEVKKGLFRKHAEIEKRMVCGLRKQI